MALYVNGERIDDARIEAEMERLRPDYERVFVEQSPAEQDEQLRRWSRENIIEAVLMRQAAREDPDPVPAEIIERAYQAYVDEQGGMDKLFENPATSFPGEPQVKRDLEQRLRLERLLARIGQDLPEPGEKEIRAYYEANIEKYTFPETVRASHIVRHVTPDVEPGQVKQELDQVLAELQNGADLADLAARHSDCPDRGGDLGYFARGQMVPAFEEVVFALPVGGFSGVFETEYGFHIATVTDRKPPVPCPLEDVRQVVTRQVARQMHQQAIERFVDDRKAKARIEEKPG